MKKISLILLLTVLIIVCASFLITVSADSVTGPSLVNPLCPVDSPNCPNSDAAGLLHSIVDWILQPGGIATTIAVGMILVGAFQIMFAGGDEERFKMGKKTILYTAIGYAIILIGWGLTSIIQDFLSH